jgi:hypothetical protein
MTAVHPRDCARTCPKCGVTGHHSFAWSQVMAPDIAGVASDEMVELVTHTCRACLSSYVTSWTERPDLDGDAHGWVTDRRNPLPPPREDRATVRPGSKTA